jgi:hypothetical protein
MESAGCVKKGAPDVRARPVAKRPIDEQMEAVLSCKRVRASGLAASPHASPDAPPGSPSSRSKKRRAAAMQHIRQKLQKGSTGSSVTWQVHTLGGRTFYISEGAGDHDSTIQYLKNIIAWRLRDKPSDEFEAAITSECIQLFAEGRENPIPDHAPLHRLRSMVPSRELFACAELPPSMSAETAAEAMD